MTTIRPFTPDDYADMVSVSNAVFPEYPDTEEDWRHEDEHMDPKCRWGRVVAEVEGRIVGLAGFAQYPGQYHPRKFHVYASVLPERQGQGIGDALASAVMDALAPHEPIQLNADTREDQLRGVQFLTRNGFEEKMRSWESRLDVAAFDPTPFLAKAQQAYDSGIVVRSYAELAEDPERERKMYELSWALTQDVPSTDKPTKLSFEYYVTERLNHPDFLPEGCFIALDGTDFVGYSNMWHSKGSTDLYTGLTGTLRSHRRRGIAMAVKLRALAYAKEVGAPIVKTWNEQNNRAMLSINEALGFVKQPAWISYVKKLADEE